MYMHVWCRERENAITWSIRKEKDQFVAFEGLTQLASSLAGWMQPSTYFSLPFSCCDPKMNTNIEQFKKQLTRESFSDAVQFEAKGGRDFFPAWPIMVRYHGSWDRTIFFQWRETNYQKVLNLRSHARSKYPYVSTLCTLSKEEIETMNRKSVKVSGREFYCLPK